MLRDLYNHYLGQDFVLIAVSTETESTINSWIASYSVPYAVAKDNGSTTFTVYGIQYIPTSILIDKNGDIAWEHIGSADFNMYKAQIDALLGP